MFHENDVFEEWGNKDRLWPDNPWHEGAPMWHSYSDAYYGGFRFRTAYRPAGTELVTPSEYTVAARNFDWSPAGIKSTEWLATIFIETSTLPENSG